MFADTIARAERPESGPFADGERAFARNAADSLIDAEGDVNLLGIGLDVGDGSGENDPSVLGELA
jgi:hypothetical protein